MSTSPTAAVTQVGILVLDENAPGGSAVKQILDSEGWRVRIVPDTQMLLSELKTGEWSLVIADVAMTGLDGPAFITLRETIRSEEHTSELQSPDHLVCRLLLEKKNLRLVVGPLLW